MEKKLSIAENLYIIGVINAITGYYSSYYKSAEESKSDSLKEGLTASNVVVLKSGKKIKSSINIFPSNEMLYISTTKHSYPGLKSEDYTGNSGVPYDKELNIVLVEVLGPNGIITEVKIEKHYDEDNFYKVLDKNTNYEEKQRFLLETLDKKGRKAYKFPSNREINPNKNELVISEEEQLEIQEKATRMSGWLATKVKEEKEAKKLIK